MDTLTTSVRRSLMALTACVSMVLSTVALGASHEDETIMAKTAGVTLQQAIATACHQVPGRVSWAAREKYDGATFVLVQVVKEDRTTQTVTLEDKTGKVVKVEPLVEKPEKPKKDDGKKNGAAEKKSSIKGTIPAGNVRPSEYPYLAKVTMQDAIKAALAKKNGKIVEVYAYQENGWVLYGIEISAAIGKIVIVKVDAGTGGVLGTVKM